MIQELYYGDVANYGSGTDSIGESKDAAIIVSDDNILYVSTFDVKELNSPSAAHQYNKYKVDILFYNRVNEVGKVVSSIVYLSEPRDGDDTSSIAYRPRFLYKNSSVELGMDLSNVTNFSYFNYLRYPAQDTAYFDTKRSKTLNIAGLPSSVLMNEYVMLDGWYTIVSAGVYYHPTPDEVATMSKGGLCIRNSTHSPYSTTDYVSIALKNSPTQSELADWHVYSNFVTPSHAAIDATKGTLLGVYLDEDRESGPSSDWAPTYTRQDFFVMSNFNRVYEILLDSYLKEGSVYGDLFTQLRSKHRPIAALLRDKNFKEAQLYLQSTDVLRTAQLEL